MNRLRWALPASTLLLVACQGDLPALDLKEVPLDPGVIVVGDDDTPPLNPACQPTVAAADWEEPLRSILITELGLPGHAVLDAIAHPGEVTTLEGKFAYGPQSSDLEGERIAIFVAPEDDPCAYASVGEAITDSDGRARIEVDTSSLGPGAHRIFMGVRGDRSSAIGRLHVIPEETPMVVFDIDGTLTTSDVELVDGIILHHVGASSDTLLDLAGSPLTRSQWLFALGLVLEEKAETWPGADDVVRHWEERGVQPVYLTGRPYLYDGLTRRWLEDFATGPLIMVQNIEEILPSKVAGFKTRQLDALTARGHSIVAAYGNAQTDICAYAAAGVSADATFIIGPNAGAGCTNEGVTTSVSVGSYPDHLAELP